MRVLIGVYLLWAQSTMACVQGSGFSLDTYMNMPRGPVPVDVGLLRDRLKADPADRLPEFETAYQPLIAAAEGAQRQHLENELAAIRDILTGNAVRAIDTLLAIEAAHPGLYATASTLGTAYELAGDNHNALQWIQTGIQRNPESHGGSEWIHVQVLQAKIAMETEPAYLATHPIVPYPDPPAQDMGELLQRNQQDKPSEEVMDALHFQLSERMLFVKPEDPVVADLLHSFARHEAARYSGKGVADLMKLARTYGYRDGTERTLAERATGIVQSPSFPGVIVLGGLALVAFIKMKSW